MAVKTIGLLVFDGVEELDAVGPYEVLASWTLGAPEDGYRLVTLSPDGADVRGAKGLRIGADGNFGGEFRGGVGGGVGKVAGRVGAEPLDLAVIVHPGRQGTRPLLRDPAHLDRVRAWARAGALMTSVCTGSLVYAAAGLLAGRPATTHWGSLDLLVSLDPSIRIDAGARFVDDGDVITSAGVSAGIDMALHLVARLAGVERARAVRRDIQYDPDPPV